MTIHHIFIEKDLKEVCPYCGETLEGKEWETEHHGRLHYKKIKCSCGKENHLLIRDFMGSGHDEWGTKKKGKEAKETIEHKIEKEHKK